MFIGIMIEAALGNWCGFLYLWSMEKKATPQTGPKNAREYYAQMDISGTPWDDLPRKTRNRWEKSYKEAYPKPAKPLIRNFTKLLADIGAALSFLHKLFPPK